MRTRSIVVGIAVATGLLVTGAVAQHEEHHQDQAAQPPASAAEKGDANKPGGTMPGNMMSQMPQMMAGQNETAKLVDRLMTSFAAMEAEKNPAARKNQLVEHGLLLKELQAKVQTQSHMMDMMQQMMAGSMMDPKMMGGKMMSGAATEEHKQ
jgi:hypothetical protein